MSASFLIWFLLSIAASVVGVSIYRKGIVLSSSGLTPIAVLEQDLVKIKKLYQEALNNVQQARQEKDQKILELESSLSLVQKRSEESVDSMRVEQEKLTKQLAEEKKYSEQSSNEYRSQIRNLDQILNQLKSEQISDERFKKSLDQSDHLIRGLREDNDLLVQSNQKLKEQLNQLESSGRQSEERVQQLQYELVKSRAELLGFEQICNDLKNKIEQLSSQKS